MQLLMLRGIPGSGKSTLAKKMVEETPLTWRRVNRDDLRTMLGGTHSKISEKLVRKIRDSIILDCLSMGYNVVVDDTNLGPWHLRELRALAEGHQFSVFILQTTLEECIRRDSLRPVPVGEEIIRRMHKQFFGDTPHPLEPAGVEVDLDTSPYRVSFAMGGVSEIAPFLATCPTLSPLEFTHE